MKKPQYLGVLLLLILPIAQAADLNFRGYASFTGGMTLDSEDTLYNYDSDLNFRNDSLVALQVDADLQDKLSATLQLVGRGSDDFNAEVEWAYLSYQIDESQRINVGRMRLPTYRYTDFEDVRYTYHWLEAPPTVYAFDFSSYDGISYIRTDYLGDWDSTLQLVYGTWEGIEDGNPNIVKDIKSFTWRLTRDWFNFGFTLQDSGKVTTISQELQPLLDTIDGIALQTGADLSELKDRFEAIEDTGQYYGVYLGAEYNDIFISTEATSFGLKDFAFEHDKAFYVSIGKRFNKFTLAYTYSEIEREFDTDTLATIPDAISQIPIPVTPDISMTLPQIISASAEFGLLDSTWQEVSFRYDFHHSAAFKLAYTQEKDRSDNKQGLLRFSLDVLF